MTEIDALVGNKIRQIRRYKNLTQEELAHRSKLHASQIGMVERGERSATVDTLYRIAVGLGVHLYQLLDFDTPYPGGIRSDVEEELLHCARQLAPDAQERLVAIVRQLTDWTASCAHTG